MVLKDHRKDAHTSRKKALAKQAAAKPKRAPQLPSNAYRYGTSLETPNVSLEEDINASVSIKNIISHHKHVYSNTSKDEIKKTEKNTEKKDEDPKVETAFLNLTSWELSTLMMLPESLTIELSDESGI